MNNDKSNPNAPMDDHDNDNDDGNYYLRLESPSPNINDLDDNDSNNDHHQAQAQEETQIIHYDDDDDDRLDDFFFNENNTNSRPLEDSHGPRPASASSIASSFIEKASSVLQETSSAVQEVIKHRTFCGSNGNTNGKIYGNGTTKRHSSFQTVPLRHTQSSPTQQHLLSGNCQQPIMKRSISTPLTFLQSRRGSAFGRVQSSSNLLESTTATVRPSAFDPVGSHNQKQQQSLVNANATLSSVKSFGNDADIDAASSCNTTDNLSISSNKMTAQALKKIKERRRRKKSSLENRDDAVSVNGNVKNVQVKADIHSTTPIHKATERLTSSQEVPQQERYTNNDGSTEAYQILNSGEWTYNTEGVESVIGSKFEVEQIQMQVPSSPAPPSPCYQKFDDDHALHPVGMGLCGDGDEHSHQHGHSSNTPLPRQRRSSTSKTAHYLSSTRNQGANARHVIKPQPRLVLPSTTANTALGSRSPCSQESSLLSKSTTKSAHSGNASSQTQYTFNSGSASLSCNRSVTSSVAEADREVRDTNRRELRRFQKDDTDGTMSVHSIQSSDTTSTNPHAYLALTSSSPHLREGANMQIERFFARNGSRATGGGGGFTNASVGGYGRPPAMNPKSPANTISSHSVSIGHSTSSGEDVNIPPQLIKAKKFSGKKVLPFVAPPEGYSKLGLDGPSGLSSSSFSNSSKSSKSHRKEQARLYQKMRASTPSPGPFNNSPYSSASPVKTPMTPLSPHQFQSSIETRGNMTRPNVCRFPTHGGGGHRNLPSNKFHLVSPNHDGGVAVRRHGVIQQGAFRRAYRTITPEKNGDD